MKLHLALHDSLKMTMIQPSLDVVVVVVVVAPIHY